MTRARTWWLIAIASCIACDGGKQAPAKTDPWAGAPAPATPTATADPWGAQPAPTPPAPAAPTAPSDPSSPVGLWSGTAFKQGLHYSMTSASYSTETQLKIVFALVLPDGRMIDGAPSAGLADFDYAAWARDVQRDASLGGYAGTYTWSGDRGQATLSTGFEEPMALSDGELTLGKGKLHRVPDVTGAKLDGTYTHFTNTADPYLDGPGCKQMITFRPDGTFEDRGAFVLACPPAPAEPNLPGTGTYTIRDYSLILSYSDGRTYKRRITPVLNAELTPGVPRFFLVDTVMNRR